MKNIIYILLIFTCSLQAQIINSYAFAQPLNPNLITNGTFDTDATGWATVSGNSTISWEAGRGRATLTSTTTDGIKQQLDDLEIGETYNITYGIDTNGTNGLVNVSIAEGSNVNGTGTTFGSYAFQSYIEVSSTFVPTTTTMYFGAKQLNGQSSGDYFEIDNISIRKQ